MASRGGLTKWHTSSADEHHVHRWHLTAKNSAEGPDWKCISGLCLKQDSAAYDCWAENADGCRGLSVFLSAAMTATGLQITFVDSLALHCPATWWSEKAMP